MGGIIEIRGIIPKTLTLGWPMLGNFYLND
jgi:hypothetical protein